MSWRSPRASRLLLQDATRTVRLLIDLTELQNQADETSSVMPRTSLGSAKGVCFSTTTRAALAVGYHYGQAFVLARLPNNRWSAPLYLTIGKVALGISYGVGVLHSCLVLESEEDVRKFEAVQPMMGPDVRIITSPEKIGNPSPSDQPAVYSICDGTMVDICFAGGAIMVNASVNAELYGPSVVPHDILSGRVQPPPEFDALYRALEALGSTEVAAEEAAARAEEEHLAAYVAQRQRERERSRAKKTATSKSPLLGPATPPLPPRPPRTARAMSLPCP